jgi:hypothetical protein
MGVVAGIIGVIGCRERERAGGVAGEGQPGTREHPGTTTVTGASVANTTAIDRLVAARCEREAACKNIGPDKKHASMPACNQKLRVDMKDELNPKECPHGIDHKELNKCIEAIGKEDCNSPIDTISRIAACRTSDLCLKASAPSR